MKYFCKYRFSPYMVMCDQTLVKDNTSILVTKSLLKHVSNTLRGNCEVGSLTGAVHLSNDNAGVLRSAQ